MPKEKNVKIKKVDSSDFKYTLCNNCRLYQAKFTTESLLYQNQLTNMLNVIICNECGYIFDKFFYQSLLVFACRSCKIRTCICCFLEDKNCTHFCSYGHCFGLKNNK